MTEMPSRSSPKPMHGTSSPTPSPLYTDGDLTLAAYAAALQVVTTYSTIDRQPLDCDLYRKLAKGESTMLRDVIGYAEPVANNVLVPEGFPKAASIASSLPIVGSLPAATARRCRIFDPEVAMPERVAQAAPRTWAPPATFPQPSRSDIVSWRQAGRCAS